jgi:hypothetical protein
VNSPFLTFSNNFAWSVGETASFTFYINCLISPYPNNLLIKETASNVYKFSKCYPSPTNIIGLFVAATADNAPPPFE